MAIWGLPDDWNTKHKSAFAGITLPDGAIFYSTIGHGYLEIDLNKLTANVSAYDYINGDKAYLEEDCSVSMWLAEHGLIPMSDYIKRMMSEIDRHPAIIGVYA
jgi:hypothetical protein